MVSNHQLDKVKLQAELESRGWKLDRYYSWVAPMGATRRTMENDWVECILLSVICPTPAQSAQLSLQPAEPQSATNHLDPSKIPCALEPPLTQLLGHNLPE